MRILILLLILCTLLAACGANELEPSSGQGAGGDTKVKNADRQEYSLVKDLEETPFNWPCQHDTEGETVKGSPATYVKGPMTVLGCITDPNGKGIKDAGTEVRVPSDATVTAMGSSTGKDGRYQEANIYVPGWYTLQVSAYGYKPLTKRVLVKEGYTAVLDFVLEPKR